MTAKIARLRWQDFPHGFRKWKLNPTGAHLQIKDLGNGAYALLSSIPGVNNTGFVVGEKGVAVIDAHFTVPMARQIQERIREVTDLPLLYLINLNYHGDHTFGNCAFPQDTRIIQQCETALRVPFMAEEKAFMTPCVEDDASIFDGVTLRPADIEFEDFYQIDLGGRRVECHYFGPANTPGDTIVYAPDAKAAWTGNMTGGIFGLALETDALVFRKTLRQFIETLDVEVLVPAHRTLAGMDLLQAYLVYFGEVSDGVGDAIRAGWSLDETLDRVTQSEAFSLPAEDPMAEVMTGRHRYNVKRTYLALTD